MYEKNISFSKKTEYTLHIPQPHRALSRAVLSSILLCCNLRLSRLDLSFACGKKVLDYRESDDIEAVRIDDSFKKNHDTSIDYNNQDG
jgi:hypothetical protein